MNEHTFHYDVVSQQNAIILEQGKLIEKQDQEIKRLYELTGQYKELYKRLVEVQDSIGQTEKLISAIKEEKK